MLSIVLVQTSSQCEQWLLSIPQQMPCNDLLKVGNLPETSPFAQYECLRFKTYKETQCLIYPSIAFSNFVQTIETVFYSIFGGVMHQNDLCKTLCKTVEKDITELHKCGIT